MSPILIVGCGYIGRRVAAVCAERGATVSGWVRSEQGFEALRGDGIAPVRVDLDVPDSLPDTGSSETTVFYFAPPPRQGDRDPRIRAFLARCRHARQLVYISTSAVYGDKGGAWVDESTPVAPDHDRGRRRLDAERCVARWGRETGIKTVILRVPGIYGPGRLPITRLRQGRPVVRLEESGYNNRIHADDLTRAAIAAAECGRDGAVYNVSDNKPAASCEYYDCVADALGLARPPRISWAEAEATFTETALSFLRGSRCMNNERMRKELGVEPRYADFRAGVEASLEASDRDPIVTE